MSHLYNEIEPNANEWLFNLMLEGEIPAGRQDARSIKELDGRRDFQGVRQFHTFAGIGGWPFALKLAGWPEDREVWTGSCPCQPFSSAGKGGGVADARHLWPEFFRLIKECRPVTIFGEQVGSKAGIGWLDGVQADLEGGGYTCGAVIVGAHSVGAPHIRQRIYWVATLEGLGNPDGAQDHAKRRPDESGRDAVERVEQAIPERQAGHDSSGRSGEAGGLADDDDEGQGRGRAKSNGGGEPSGVGPWSDYRIIPCTDGKARRTGTRVFPLAHGIPRRMEQDGAWRKGLARGASRARIGMLKGSGNAIVPALAAEFIKAYMEIL